MDETLPKKPELCECGRLYKSCLDKNGNEVCPSCKTGFSPESLKLLWSTPIKNTSYKLEPMPKLPFYTQIKEHSPNFIIKKDVEQE